MPFLRQCSCFSGLSTGATLHSFEHSSSWGGAQMTSANSIIRELQRVLLALVCLQKIPLVHLDTTRFFLKESCFNNVRNKLQFHDGSVLECQKIFYNLLDSIWLFSPLGWLLQLLQNVSFSKCSQIVSFFSVTIKQKSQNKNKKSKTKFENRVCVWV